MRRRLHYFDHIYFCTPAYTANGIVSAASNALDEKGFVLLVLSILWFRQVRAAIIDENISESVVSNANAFPN